MNCQSLKRHPLELAFKVLFLLRLKSHLTLFLSLLFSVCSPLSLSLYLWLRQYFPTAHERKSISNNLYFRFKKSANIQIPDYSGFFCYHLLQVQPPFNQMPRICKKNAISTCFISNATLTILLQKCQSYRLTWIYTVRTFSNAAIPCENRINGGISKELLK